MKILILGGTKFLGRHLVHAALAQGHELTLFNRGASNQQLFPEIEHLSGDRDGNLAALAGRKFDAVIDTSGYVPRVVRQSLDLLREQTDHYTFISSVSAYADFSAGKVDEASTASKLEDPLTEDIPAHYGALKATCEQEVEQAFEGRALHIRPGLIVGPHDPTDRFTYWPVRYADGGEILVPGSRERAVQFIDVRDLAEWTIRLVEGKQAGVFNATGPDTQITMGTLADALERSSVNRCNTVWVDEPFLHEHEVREWIELPLWVSERMNWPQFMKVSVDKALASGLTCRPIEQTIADTLAWHRSREPYREWKAGLSREREQQLLQQFQGA